MFEKFLKYLKNKILIIIFVFLLVIILLAGMLSSNKNNIKDYDKKLPDVSANFDYYFTGADSAIFENEKMPLYLGNYDLDYVKVKWELENKFYVTKHELFNKKDNLKLFYISLPDAIKKKVEGNEVIPFSIKLANDVEIIGKNIILNNSKRVSVTHNNRTYNELYIKRGMKILVAEDVEPRQRNIILSAIDELPEEFVFNSLTVYLAGKMLPSDLAPASFNGAAVYIDGVNEKTETYKGRGIVPIIEFYLVHELAHNLQQFVYIDSKNENRSMTEIGNLWYEEAMRHYNFFKEDNPSAFLEPGIVAPSMIMSSPPDDLANAWADLTFGNSSFFPEYKYYFDLADKYMDMVKAQIIKFKNLTINKDINQ